MDSAILTPMDLAGCGEWQPHQGEVDGPGAAAQANLPGQHPCGNHRGSGLVLLNEDVRLSGGRSGGPRLGQEGSGNVRTPGQGAVELGFPGPASGKMQGEAPCLAGVRSGQGEEAPPEGLGSYQLLSQADARGPAGQVVGPVNFLPSAHFRTIWSALGWGLRRDSMRPLRPQALGFHCGVQRQLPPRMRFRLAD